MEILIRRPWRVSLSPLIQEMQRTAVHFINPVDGLPELLPFRPLPLGTLRSAMLRSGPASAGTDRAGYIQFHIGGQLSGSLIGRQPEQERGEPDHIALLLTAEADEILIDLHARRFIIVKRAAHHAAPADLVSVKLCGIARADLFLHFGKNAHSDYLLSESRTSFDTPFRHEKSACL